MYGWYIYQDIKDYYQVISDNITNNPQYQIPKVRWKNIIKFADSKEWEIQVTQFISLYYCSSQNYNDADNRFNDSISPFLKYFKNKEQFIFLLKKIEENSYVYDRELGI